MLAHQALHHARNGSLSAALFAPGWVLESLGATDFEKNDYRYCLFLSFVLVLEERVSSGSVICCEIAECKKNVFGFLT